jgi:glycosyltransferase involved in cell wall biosynthesis
VKGDIQGISPLSPFARYFKGSFGPGEDLLLKGLKVAYVLHWFPEPSETFIFNEVRHFQQRGVEVRVFTLYGELRRNLSPEMFSTSIWIERLGARFVLRIPGALRFWRRRSPAAFHELFRTIPIRRWCDLEMAGENLWAFLCGFQLGRRFSEMGIRHIHAPWANGPATAAWAASRLSGIPFSFAAHATDIYPPDGALAEKISAASFVRTENQANVDHLCRHAVTEADRLKIHLVYSGHPVRLAGAAEVPMEPPYRLLAVGRFVRKKGFDVLLRACSILGEKGIQFRLTLAGDGPQTRRLHSLAGELNLGAQLEFPGFVRYDKIPALLSQADVFLMPSIIDPSGDRDGLPNVIVEALLQRVPVVATDVCGISEVIRHGITGILVPPNDPAALAGAVLDLVRDRSRALHMAESGRRLVLERFDAERCFAAVLKLIAGAVTT